MSPTESGSAPARAHAARSIPPIVTALRTIGERTDLDASEKTVLRALLEWWNPQTGELWPAVGLIASRCSMSERGVRGVLRRLKAHGILAAVANSRGGRTPEGMGLSTRYVLTLNPAPRSELQASNPEPSAGLNPERDDRQPGTRRPTTRNGTTENPERNAPKLTNELTNEHTSEHPKRAAAPLGGFPNRAAKKLTLTEALRHPTPMDWPAEMTRLWGDWLTVRCADTRKIPSRRALELALEDLEKWGIAKGMMALRDAVKGGWQGLHEPRGPVGDSPNSDARKAARQAQIDRVMRRVESASPPPDRRRAAQYDEDLALPITRVSGGGSVGLASATPL